MMSPFVLCIPQRGLPRWQLFQLSSRRYTLRPHQLCQRAFSKNSRQFQVTQFRAADHLPSNEEHDTKPSRRKRRNVTVYTSQASASQWTTTIADQKDEKTSVLSPSPSMLEAITVRQYLFDNVIAHFLPAQYPHSVAEGYARFALLAFCASTAGSAAMVLSTQTLLLAVGVVGANASATHHASIMAGALNWVLKDGIGQLGGVIFASRMGHTKRFDSDPKRWRMLAALSLDGASLLEIVSPLIWSSWVLPVACTANVGKNIGFLTASASRAAIHQSLARQGNLADVTAKSGTQSMAAGLTGTAVGIGLSTLLQHDATNFVAGFCVLSAIHQGCNYWSLKAVPLRHFNRHRLHCLLAEYCFVTTTTSQQSTPVVLTPSQVAYREQYFPFIPSTDDSHSWLAIGSSLSDFCPVQDFEQLHELFREEAYLLNVVEGKLHLVFQEHATGDDLVQGMFHAYQLRHHQMQSEAAEDTLSIIANSYEIVQEKFPQLQEELHRQGWTTGTDVTNIEPSRAYRLSIESKP